jgi:glycosyltransferase involved in cell wall biosynthesis/O-antigen/teichoic acid export membrane protein
MRDEKASPASSSPRVSVCLPVYNGSDYVAEAVNSVLRQTWTDFELVIQDNCSTDTTACVLESFRDSRISVERNATNIGIVGNINRAIARSHGEYVRLLCHDDTLAPTCLEEQVRFLEARPSVALAFTWFEGIDAAGQSLGPMFLDRFIPEPEILSPREASVFLYGKGCTPHMSTAMARRESLLPFDASFRACVDWAKWAEVSARADIAIIRKILSAVRYHDRNLTYTVKRYHTAETYRVLEMLETRLPANFPTARVRRSFYGKEEFAYAVWLALTGRVGSAREVMATIRQHDPLLPVAFAFLCSLPAWLKRRLAGNGGAVLKAQARAEEEIERGEATFSERPAAGERLTTPTPTPASTATVRPPVDSSRALLGTAIVNSLYVALGLLVASMLARTLGPEGRGAYAAILSLPMGLAIIATFGLPNAMLLEASRRPEETGAAFVTAQLAALLLFVPIAVASWLLLPSMLASYDARTIASARWFLVLSVPAMGAFALATTAVQGAQNFRAWNWLRASQMVAWPVLLVGAGALGYRSPYVYAPLLAVSYLLTLPAVLACLARRSPRPWRFDPHIARRMFTFSVSAWIALMPREVNRRADQLALAVVASPATLGLYAVGATIATLVGHLVGPAANVVAPKVAAASGDEHQRIFANFGRFSVIVAIGGGAATAMVAPLAMRVLFGHSFAPAIGAALILIAAAAVEAVARVLGDALLALGRPSRLLRAELAGVAVMGAGLWLALPQHPLVGTALTCLASRAAILAVTAQQISSALAMRPRSFLVPTVADGREFLARAEELICSLGKRLRRRNELPRSETRDAPPERLEGG